MNSLFETGPLIDKHIEAIIKIILTRLPNNNPKKDSKCYLRTANFINELYLGTFLRNNRFDKSKDSQFNVDNIFDIIQSCNSDWNKIKTLVVQVLDNIETAKRPEKLPWNKKYVNEISFAKFFDNGYNQDGEIDSPFLHFVNEPKDSLAYRSDITIGKIKEVLPVHLKNAAEKICKKYFKMKSYQLSFWYNMEEWNEWLNNLRNAFPNIYSEFVANCKDSNPLADFQEYLITSLKKSEGEYPSVNHWYYSITNSEKVQLNGFFKGWLQDGIRKNKFSALKQLPQSIDKYVTKESFETNKQVKKVEKKTVDFEDIIVF